MTTFPIGDTAPLATLQWLIAPVPVAELIERYWDMQPLHIERKAPDHFAGLLAWSDIDALLAFAGSEEGIELIRDGQRNLPRQQGKSNRASLSRYFDLYAQGFVIELQEVHARHAPIASLANALSHELGFGVSVDAWIAPPSSGKVEHRHADHDAFAMQVAGEATWQLGASPGEIRLAAGDALYLPRGTEHHWTTTAQSSLCLMIGVQVKTWRDLFIKAVEALSERDIELRRAIGAGVLTRPDRAHVASRWQDIRDSVCRQLRMEDGRVKLSIEHKACMQPLPDGHFTQMRLVDGIGPATLVERRPGVASEMQFAHGGVELVFPGNYQFGPDKLFLALDFIKTSQRFRVEEIQGWYSTGEKLLIVRYLVRKGYLRIVEEP